MQDIWIAIIGMAGSVAVAVITGIFSSRNYLRKQLARAEADAVEHRSHSHARAVAMRKLIADICKVLFWIIFSLEKAEAVTNGEQEKLKQAFEDLEKSEQKLKEVERNIIIDVDE